MRELRQLILDGQAPAGLRISGKLDFSEVADQLTQLPEDLSVGWLDISGCKSLQSLPESLKARRISMQGNWDPTPLLQGLRCFQLDLQNTQLKQLPADLAVDYRLDLEGCVQLQQLPAGFKVGSLMLRGCTSLRSLPEGLHCYFLDISGCISLRGWPNDASLSVGRLAMRSCAQIDALPDWLGSIAQLDLRDCRGIAELPRTLHVSSWIDVAGTTIRYLPAELKGVPLRWRGVPIEERIAFAPETITGEEVLAESNAERRRVLLERMGYENFLTATHAELLDEDRDPGGPRRLLRVALADDEPLVCVSVLCPSTARQYVIRVPPTMTTCHHAAAWIAGFDNPDDYRPLAET